MNYDIDKNRLSSSKLVIIEYLPNSFPQEVVPYRSFFSLIPMLFLHNIARTNCKISRSFVFPESGTNTNPAIFSWRLVL